MKRTIAVLNIGLMFCAYLLALFHGMAPLGDDPDLGAHIAAGLWILDLWQIPFRDPFGAQGNPVTCYSWLADVPMGLAYRLGGFFGVKCLAILFFLLPVACAILLVQALRRPRTAVPDLTTVASEWFTIALMIAFTWPAWSLRPQILSWIFFAVLIVAIDRNRFRPALFIPLTIVWANTHVFWPLVPILFFLSAVFTRPRSPAALARSAAQALGYLALGLVNPYGWGLFAVIWNFAFHSGSVNAMVGELAPVRVFSPSFWLLAATLTAVAASAKRVATREHPLHVLLFLLLAAQSARQIRYFPLFAIAAAPILARSTMPFLLGFFSPGPPPPETTAPAEPERAWLAPVAIALVMWIIGGLFIRQEPPLKPRHRDLLQIAERLARSPAFGERPRVTVLSEANDGGWLELFFWITRPPGAVENRFKAAIDNRGHVVSQQRFAEYDQVRRLSGNWAPLFNAWDIDVVIAPGAADLLATLARGTDATGQPLGTWKLFDRVGGFAVWARVSPAS